MGFPYSYSSSRIYSIGDVRGGTVYSFTYNTDPIPHLTGITNSIGTAENYTFHYASNQPLNSPFSPPVNFGNNWTFLTSVANAIPLTTSFTYDSAGSGELDAVTFPYKGQIGWTYGSFNYSGTRTYREVQGRSLVMSQGASALNYGISYQSTSGITFHTYSQFEDPDGNAEKAWSFSTDSQQVGFGLVNVFDNRPHHWPNIAGGHKDAYTWTADSAGNPYVSEDITTEDESNPGQTSKATTQTLDQYGNVTQMQVYDYGNLSTPARTYTNTYLSTSPYTSRYIFNRLLTSTVTDGTHTTALATNTYDCCNLNDAPGIQEHLPVTTPHFRRGGM